MTAAELIVQGLGALGVFAAGVGIGRWLKGKPPRKTNWDDVDRRIDERRGKP